MAHTSTMKAIQFDGDTLTPIAIKKRLSGTKGFLLESSLKHEQKGRYSFLGVNPSIELITTEEEHTILFHEQGKKVSRQKHERTVDILAELVQTVDTTTLGLPPLPFLGGAVGYVGYDCIRQVEEIGELLNNDASLPMAHLLIYDTVVAYDHKQQTVHIVAIGRNGETEEELETRCVQVKTEIQTPQRESDEQIEFGQIESNCTKKEFEANVLKAKELIREGEVFQIVLSQRLQRTYSGDAFSFYRELRRQNPSPYLYYVNFGDYIVLGSSPESLVSVQGDNVKTNPIAGTRRRGATEEEDTALEKELRLDEKEQAEHDMLVDLGRNDLGKVCKTGSVHVNRYQEVDRYRHVMHLVSEVTGALQDGVQPLDALMSCLPAGTVSGAPKIRAMQWINTLESVQRGPYGGALGYFSYNGNLDFALVIRTMILKDDVAYVQAGAGIVHDSIPESEYEETLHKAKALLGGA